MNNRTRMGDKTEPSGTPLLTGLREDKWPSTEAAIKWPQRKLEIKVVKH